MKRKSSLEIDNPQLASKYFSDGKEYFNCREYETCIYLLKKSLELGNESYELYEYLGRANDKLDITIEADQYFKKASKAKFITDNNITSPNNSEDSTHSLIDISTSPSQNAYVDLTHQGESEDLTSSASNAKKRNSNSLSSANSHIDKKGEISKDELISRDVPNYNIIDETSTSREIQDNINLFINDVKANIEPNIMVENLQSKLGNYNPTKKMLVKIKEFVEPISKSFENATIIQLQQAFNIMNIIFSNYVLPRKRISDESRFESSPHSLQRGMAVVFSWYLYYNIVNELFKRIDANEECDLALSNHFGFFDVCKIGAIPNSYKEAYISLIEIRINKFIFESDSNNNLSVSKSNQYHIIKEWLNLKCVQGKAGPKNIYNKTREDLINYINRVGITSQHIDNSTHNATPKQITFPTTPYILPIATTNLTPALNNPPPTCLPPPFNQLNVRNNVPTLLSLNTVFLSSNQSVHNVEPNNASIAQNSDANNFNVNNPIDVRTLPIQVPVTIPPTFNPYVVSTPPPLNIGGITSEDLLKNTYIPPTNLGVQISNNVQLPINVLKNTAPPSPSIYYSDRS